MSLIVIEGLDGSGKGTQSQLLFEYVKSKNLNIKKVSFPNYDSPSSALVKMYLGGEFGTDANAVNPYAASTFYAVDRYASFNTVWKDDYQKDWVILADRYTTSNIIFQLSKMEKEKWEEFANWIENLEYVKMNLPKPDLVIYLDMPIEVSQKLLAKRYDGDENKKDIHERDMNFLNHCRESGLFAANLLDWKIISCSENGEARLLEEITKEIISEVEKANLL